MLIFKISVNRQIFFVEVFGVLVTTTDLPNAIWVLQKNLHQQMIVRILIDGPVVAIVRNQAWILLDEGVHVLTKIPVHPVSVDTGLEFVLRIVEERLDVGI